LLLALAILGLFALSRNKGTASTSAIKVKDNSKKIANNTEVERENITDVQT